MKSVRLVTKLENFWYTPIMRAYDIGYEKGIEIKI